MTPFLRLPRSLPCLALTLLLSTPEHLAAQVYSRGDVVVWTRTAGTPPVDALIVVEPNGASFPITGFNPAPLFTAWEVDPQTGDILFALATPNGIDLWRAVIAGTSVFSQTLVMTIPNTAGLTPAYLHREFSGGFLLLSHNGLLNENHLHRIGMTRTGAIAYALPTIVALPRCTDLTTDANGLIYLVGPNQLGSSKSVFQVPFAGAAAATTLMTFSAVTPFAVEVEGPSNRLFVGGLTTSGGTNPVNLLCASTAGALSGAALIGSASTSTQGCVDLQIEPGGGSLLAALNGNGVSYIDRHTVTGCGVFTATLFQAPQGMALHKLAIFPATSTPVGNEQPLHTNRFGYPRETLTNSVMQQDELLPATIGGTWAVQVTGVTGANAIPLAFFTLGLSDATSGGQPLPIDMAPNGFDRCAVFVSLDQTVALPVNGGVAVQALAVPNSPGLVGLRLFSQWAAIDGNVACQSSALTTVVQ